jgi:hypothetical protein
MSGRLVRVRDRHLRSSTYVVAELEADRAVELIRSSVGSWADEVTDLGRVSAGLLKALSLKSGDFKNIEEPPLPRGQQTQMAT